MRGLRVMRAAFCGARRPETFRSALGPPGGMLSARSHKIRGLSIPQEFAPARDAISMDENRDGAGSRAIRKVVDGKCVNVVK